MAGSLHRVAIGDHFAGLVLKQIDGVAGVMPEQMVGPTAWLAGRVRVRAPEEIGLHVHLLNLQLALADAIVNPLMTGIESPHMPGHGDDPGVLLDLHQLFRIGHIVGDRNLDQHMLARAHALLALAKVHLRRGGEDDGLGALDALCKIAGEVRNTVLLRHFGGGVLIAADKRHDLDVGDALERVEMLLTESTLTGNADLHRLPLRTLALARAAARFFAFFFGAAARLARPAPARETLRLALPEEPLRFSRMRCPTAVFEAGTV